MLEAEAAVYAIAHPSMSAHLERHPMVLKTQTLSAITK